MTNSNLVERPYFFRDENGSELICGDAITIMNQLKAEAFDMVFADPPYFLSNGGITCKNGKMASVDKGDWDKLSSFEEIHAFNRKWIRCVKRVLKPNGTVWISGTFHNIYSIGIALEQEGFKILNNITWQKTNPPPNLSCRYFTHSTETILWARKSGKKVKHYFNYDLMKELNGGKQMKDVWSGPTTPRSEKKFGQHPTQKPEYLLNRIILASTREDDQILDPFVGSGTTNVVAKKLGRGCLGIDKEVKYLQIARQRLENIK